MDGINSFSSLNKIELKQDVKRPDFENKVSESLKDGNISADEFKQLKSLSNSSEKDLKNALDQLSSEVKSSFGGKTDSVISTEKVKNADNFLNNLKSSGENKSDNSIINEIKNYKSADIPLATVQFPMSSAGFKIGLDSIKNPVLDSEKARQVGDKELNSVQKMSAIVKQLDSELRGVKHS